MPSCVAVQDALDGFHVTCHSEFVTINRVDLSQLTQPATAVAVPGWELVTMPQRLPRGVMP
jgi:hypothetical protein